MVLFGFGILAVAASSIKVALVEVPQEKVLGVVQEPKRKWKWIAIKKWMGRNRPIRVVGIVL